MPAPYFSTLLEKFHLDPEDRAKCGSYFILYWPARYVTERLEFSEVIMKDGYSYHPILLDRLTWQALLAAPEETVRISFRRRKGLKVGVALIKAAPVVETSKPSL